MFNHYTGPQLLTSLSLHCMLTVTMEKEKVKMGVTDDDHSFLL